MVTVGFTALLFRGELWIFFTPNCARKSVGWDRKMCTFRPVCVSGGCRMLASLVALRRGAAHCVPIPKPTISTQTHPLYLRHLGCIERYPLASLVLSAQRSSPPPCTQPYPLYPALPTVPRPTLCTRSRHLCSSRPGNRRAGSHGNVRRRASCM